MNNKHNLISTQKILGICGDIIRERTFVFFLFSKKKRFQLNLRSYKLNLNEVYLITEIITLFIRNKLKKIYYEYNKNILILSKDKFKIFNIDYDYKIGLLHNIPKCCIKKYCEEEKGKPSYNPAKRYLNQLNELKIKEDKFNIQNCNEGAFCEDYGFIPCHPKCKNALKLANKYDKIIEDLNKNG